MGNRKAKILSDLGCEFSNKYRLNDDPVPEARKTKRETKRVGEVQFGVKAVNGSPIAAKFIYYKAKHSRDLPREVKVLQRTSCVDGVVKILDSFKSPHGFVMILERPMNAVDLFRYCENQRVDEALARDILNQLLSIVADLRIRNIVHRDIKPENILIDTETKKITLIDFESATNWNHEPFSRFLGSSGYEPPESVWYNKYYSDQFLSWTLGVLVYDLLYRNYPFSKRKFIGKKKVTFNPLTQTAACQDLIEKCLEPDEHKRIKVSDIKQHKWLTQKA